MPPYFFALAPLGWAWSSAVSLRAYMYRTGLLKTKRLACKVISIGNITAGGTGKTPMTALVVRRLLEKKLRVVVLTRGYGGTREGETLVVSDGKDTKLAASESGDEPALLAGLLPGLPIVMGARRFDAGMLAMERFSPDVAVLDDGFQHMALYRDLDILLMDARRPLGNGRVLPAGYLREPACASARADIVVLTRSEGLGEAEIEASRSLVRKVSGGRPAVTAKHVVSRMTRLWEDGEMGLEQLAGKGVFAFSGIADPASFALILKRLGAKIIKFRVFPDHHAYTQAELAEICAQAMEAGAGAVVTTEKDAVKLGRLERPGIDVFSVGVELELTGGAEALDRLITEKVLEG